jgi:UDP-4-amino-4,6-dideoxy-N-acetyl-beta-L-altrosamine N-acetyltransferase
MDEANSSVAFRGLELGDMVRLHEWRNLPDVARYMYTDHWISEREHARWFGEAMSDAARRCWIIQLDDVPVGLLNLYGISERHRRAYWAFYLADASTRGRGVGAAAERFVLHYAFAELGLDVLCCEVLATNEGVVRMHQRYGFSIDGVLRKHVVKEGNRVDVVTRSLLREDWQSGRWAEGG